LVTKGTIGKTAVRAWTARIVSGPDAGQEVSLGSRAVLVGADKTCDLVLSDPKVSRQHVEIQGRPDGIHVKDLGSTNGTTWQASRVSEAVVPVGSSIEVGNTKIQFTAAAAPILPPSQRRQFGGLVGSSAVMRELFAVLEMASPTDATVLIQGESGTGKEIAARAIHDHSKRAAKAFVVLDGSATNEQLIESQLFGHKKGAFTGAVSDRKGAFLEADGGTLFIDELGELPLSLQAKLLRALEQREVVPVGSDQPERADVRIVAATHRDLFQMVEEKAFRFDLFHRLAVVHITMPSLREHLEDLADLIAHLYTARGMTAKNLEGENLAALAAHSWPGNVRELRNVLDRAWALSPESEDFSSLRMWLHQSADSPALEVVDVNLPFKEAKERWVERFERRYLSAVFSSHAENITHAAEHAGIGRRHFRELLLKHGLKDE